MTHQSLVIKMRMTMIPLAIDKLTLSRYPKTSDQSLRAWNSADEYLVEHVSENITLDESSKILIINDQFGALTCSLSEHSPVCWSDSFLSRTAITDNLKTNNLPEKISFIERVEDIPQAKTHFDLVIIRIPKHNSLLAFQLNSIAQFINHNTIIIASGMTKEIHNSTSALFSKHIGETTTSLAKKKARLIFSKPSSTPKVSNENRYEDLNDIKIYELENYDVKSYGLPGVFSRESLDIGSRVLLNYLPETKENQKLIDLGCGTGILGTIVAKDNSTLNLTFCDESFLAVESAKITYDKNIGRSAEFHVTDVLAGLENDYYDHILCNPPFHQQNVQTLSIANKMFKQSALKLKDRGELRVVANRHLKYRPMLSQYFKSVKMISNDSKFVVWLATNPQP